MKKILILLMVAGFMACNNGAKVQEKKTDTVAPAQIVETSLSIGGMTCDDCVKSVAKGLNQLDGITDVAVTLEDSTAVVKYDASLVSLDDMRAAIERRGYRLKSELN